MMLIVLTSCSSVPNINDDDELKSFLGTRKMYLQGDCTFDKNGTFQIIPAAPGDKTPIYRGSYSFGKIDGIRREITMHFDNGGDITDGSTFNGTNFKGVGRRLHGWLIATKYHWKVKADIEMDINDAAGYKVGTEGETEINTTTTETYELESR
jgi:hypothetical protein